MSSAAREGQIFDTSDLRSSCSMRLEELMTMQMQVPVKEYHEDPMVLASALRLSLQVRLVLT